MKSKSKPTKKVKALPKAKKDRKKTGRPSGYSDRLADLICNAISESSKGLVTLCNENEAFPSVRVVHKWIEQNEYFQHKYARARELQAEFLADEIIEIADDKSGDIQIDDDGVESMNNEFVQRSRLKVDARKWKASKLAPKKYGDKLDVTTGGDKINTTYDLSKLSTSALEELAKVGSDKG